MKSKTQINSKKMQRPTRKSTGKPSGKPTAEWVAKFKNQIYSFTDRGDYKGALPIVKSALRDYPDEFDVKFNYAKILGDWADELPPSRKKKMKAEAIAVLKPLVRSMSSQPALSRFSVSLNYYYQSESWKSMYAFGKRFARFDKQKSFYAQGLAATLVAFEELEKNRLSASRSWANRAVKAWKKYDLKNESYYFAPYNYAKALALTGDFKRSVTELKRAAKLGKRPITDWEFADVLTLIPGEFV